MSRPFPAVKIGPCAPAPSGVGAPGNQPRLGAGGGVDRGGRALQPLHPGDFAGRQLIAMAAHQERVQLDAGRVGAGREGAGDFFPEFMKSGDIVRRASPVSLRRR